MLFDETPLSPNPFALAMGIRGTGLAFPKCFHIALVEMPLDWKGLENPFREDALGWGILKCLSELFCSRNVPSSALFAFFGFPAGKHIEYCLIYRIACFEANAFAFSLD